MKDLPDLTIVAIPLYILTMSLEAFLHWRRPRQGQYGYSWRDARTSILMGLGSLVVGAVFAGIHLVFLTFFSRFALLDLGAVISAGTGAALVAAWLVLFVADDLCYYWFHRVHHESRVFWAAHVTHHSSQYYNLSTALRQSWTPLTSWAFYIPVMLLGFTPAQWAFMHSINLLFQYWIHTERIDRMPRWFEFTFNTPSHHRVHHGANPQYIDTNYGGILIVWDRMFGSFVAEGDAVRYGLTTNITTYNPIKVAFHEFYAIGVDVKNARSWRERLGFVFYHPGWRPTADAEPVAAQGVATSPRQ